jgi:hypothetical protein
MEAIREEARGLPRGLPGRTRSAMSGPAQGPNPPPGPIIFDIVRAGGVGNASPSGNVRWLSASARVGASRAGHVFAAALLDHYKGRCARCKRSGIAYQTTVWPYMRAAVGRFSPGRRRPGPLREASGDPAGQGLRRERATMAVAAGPP